MRYARPVDVGEGRPPREDSFVLFQAATPQVELPEGFDLATLGRLGLRVTGMSAEEALSFSRAIDWRATLLVPVPVQGGTFREVEVSGRKGLLVTMQPPPKASSRRGLPPRGPPGAPAVVHGRQGLRDPRPGHARRCRAPRDGAVDPVAVAEPALEAQALRKDFGPKTAVRDLTLSVPRGEVFGFLGPNGAGKTTSIKMLLGLVHPTAGGGRLLGEPIGTTRARARVGYLPEHFAFHEWLRGRELLRFHGRLLGLGGPTLEERIEALLRRRGARRRPATAVSASTARA